MTETTRPASGHRLTYGTPAQRWTDALPIGNGRLGAMVYGDPDHDRWQINDDTCWSGWPGSAAGVPASDEPSPQVVERVRSALLDGDVVTAEREIRLVQYGHSQAYQPLAELDVEVTGSNAVLRHRTLDLGAAVAGWHADGGAGASTGEAFVSAPAAALVGRYRWEQPVDLTVGVTAAHADLGLATVAVETAPGSRLVLVSRMPTDVFPHHEPGDQAVHVDPAPGRAVTAVLVAEVRTDGRVVDRGDRLAIDSATTLEVVVTTETDFVDARTLPHGDRDALVRSARGRAARVADRAYQDLLAEHEAEHRSWFDRFDLRLGAAPARAVGADPEETADPDTDALLVRAAAGDVDPRLTALMVQYGRYLMIASSRPGTRAINLQGIWNPWVQPPWSSNYTVNINTEMNYWPAGPANLIECAEPLFELVEAMAATGTDTARRVYGRPGWAAHHNADVWGYSLPVGNGTSNPCWAAWPMAGFWLLRHLWEHYQFTADDDFWVDRAWPLLDGAVQFGLATVVTLPDQTLGVAPSTSPENSYLTADGTRAAVAVSATMDLALLRDVFRMWRDTADLVRARGGAVEVEREHAVADALSRLPWPEPTERGTYPEWRDDLTEAEPTHRHQSHLYDVFPGDAVNVYHPDHAALLAAARETLRQRGAYSTGWSLAWRIALHARLRDVDAATTSLGFFLAPVPVDDGTDLGRGFAQAGGVYRNLFCAHPPFQIDGNFGAAAGVIELLVQSHGWADRAAGVRIIDLLPCLPSAWPHGHLHGVRARGGLTLDVEWADGEATAVAITADRDQRLVLRLPGRTDQVVELSAGQRWSWPG